MKGFEEVKIMIDHLMATFVKMSYSCKILKKHKDKCCQGPHVDPVIAKTVNDKKLAN